LFVLSRIGAINIEAACIGGEGGRIAVALVGDCRDAAGGRVEVWWGDDLEIGRREVTQFFEEFLVDPHVSIHGVLALVSIGEISLKAQRKGGDSIAIRDNSTISLQSGDNSLEICRIVWICIRNVIVIF